MGAAIEAGAEDVITNDDGSIEVIAPTISVAAHRPEKGFKRSSRKSPSSPPSKA
jgi:transcriptional/translational regulatory protein YebC/TACO1